MHMGIKSNNLAFGERTDKCRRMRHNCEKNECFEQKYRCQLGKLDHLFPGNNGMTDVDGYCFINGRKIFLEWKTGNRGIGNRQLEALKALSLDALVIIAWGDPMEMMPTNFLTINRGIVSDIISGNDAPFYFDRAIKEWFSDIY